jgi:hypothetical protein
VATLYTGSQNMWQNYLRYLAIICDSVRLQGNVVSVQVRDGLLQPGVVQGNSAQKRANMYIYYIIKHNRKPDAHFSKQLVCMDQHAFFAVSNPMPHSTNTDVMATSLFTSLKACTVSVAKKGLHFFINYLAGGKGLESSLRILVL